MKHKTESAPQFDEWAIIELFGHQKMAGHVTEASIGGMLRVDVHNANGEVLYTRLINPKAIYAINPTSKDLALAVGERFAKPPVARWELPQLAAPTREDEPEDDWVDVYEDDDRAF